MYAEREGDRPKARLVGVECVRMQAAEPDPSGARRALPIPGSNFILPADTLLTALGEEPDFGFLPPEITRKGYVVKVDEFGRTNHPGFFAGGDITGEPRTVAHSLGSGKRAAIGIDRYLREKAGEPVRRGRPEGAALRRHRQLQHHPLAQGRPRPPRRRAERGGAVRAPEHGALHERARQAGPRTARSRSAARASPRPIWGSPPTKRSPRRAAASTAASATSASCASSSAPTSPSSAIRAGTGFSLSVQVLQGLRHLRGGMPARRHDHDEGGPVKKVIMGNHAVSWGVRLARAEVIAAYPITPQTQIVEELSEMCADRRPEGALHQGRVGALGDGGLHRRRRPRAPAPSPPRRRRASPSCTRCCTGRPGPACRS